MNTKAKALYKTVTWRITATTITTLIIFGLTGNIELGITGGAIEAVTKMIAYYSHERAWEKIR